MLTDTHQVTSTTKCSFCRLCEHFCTGPNVAPLEINGTPAQSNNLLLLCLCASVKVFISLNNIVSALPPILWHWKI